MVFFLNPLIFIFSPPQAFVFFSDWNSCCNFVRDHIANPVSVKDCPLSVHFVLQDMHPEFTEVWTQAVSE